MKTSAILILCFALASVIFAAEDCQLDEPDANGDNPCENANTRAVAGGKNYCCTNPGAGIFTSSSNNNGTLEVECICGTSEEACEQLGGYHCRQWGSQFRRGNQGAKQ